MGVPSSRSCSEKGGKSADDLGDETESSPETSSARRAKWTRSTRSRGQVDWAVKRGTGRQEGGTVLPIHLGLFLLIQPRGSYTDKHRRPRGPQGVGYPPPRISTRV